MMFGKRDEATEHTVPIRSEREIDLGPIGGRTVVGRQTLVRGVVKGDGPVVIRGAVEGEIVLKGSLSVAPGGRVDAEVQAHTVEISGEAQGTMRAAGRVLMSASAVFEGDMHAASLITQPGSILQGRARITGMMPSTPGRSR